MLPPEPVKVVLLPEQIVDKVAFAVMLGNGLTVILTVAVLVHPLPLVPVTVNVLVVEGVTVIGDPVEPLLQL